MSDFQNIWYERSMDKSAMIVVFFEICDEILFLIFIWVFTILRIVFSKFQKLFNYLTTLSKKNERHV